MRSSLHLLACANEVNNQSDICCHADKGCTIACSPSAQIALYTAELNQGTYYTHQRTTCDEDTENCKAIKRGLKTKYVDLEDDYSNLLVHTVLTDVDSKWVKKDDRMSVFYASEDDELTWGYAMPIDNAIQSVFDVMEGTIDYLNMLEGLMGL